MSTVPTDFVLKPNTPLGEQFSQALEVQGKAAKTMYGFLSNASKKKYLEIIRALIYKSDSSKKKDNKKIKSTDDNKIQIKCSLCKKGNMINW